MKTNGSILTVNINIYIMHRIGDIRSTTDIVMYDRYIL